MRSVQSLNLKAVFDKDLQALHCHHKAHTNKAWERNAAISYLALASCLSHCLLVICTNLHINIIAEVTNFQTPADVIVHLQSVLNSTEDVSNPTIWSLCSATENPSLLSFPLKIACPMINFFVVVV